MGLLGGPGRSKMLQIGKNCSARGKRLLVGILVIATVNGIPRGPILVGKSKSTGGGAISGAQFLVLGTLQHGSQMLKIGERLRTQRKGLLAGILVIETINVVPSSPIARGTKRFAVGIAIF